MPIVFIFFVCVLLPIAYVIKGERAHILRLREVGRISERCHAVTDNLHFFLTGACFVAKDTPVLGSMA
jgi:hypothetical protein